MNKKEINAKLKELGLGFVKMNTPTSYDLKSGKCHTDWDGKKSKGFIGGSIGPMTMTNAHQGHNRQVEDKIREEFPRNFSYEVNTLVLTFDKIVYKFEWKLFPANTVACDLDSGYQNYWLTLVK